MDSQTDSDTECHTCTYTFEHSDAYTLRRVRIGKCISINVNILISYTHIVLIHSIMCMCILVCREMLTDLYTQMCTYSHTSYIRTFVFTHWRQICSRNVYDDAYIK